MLDINDADITELKEILSDYLQGKSSRVINVRFAELTEKYHISCQELYASIPLNKKQTQNDIYIIAILASLNIDKNSNEFKALIDSSKNLYELLLNALHDNLYKKNHYHLASLLQHIDNAHPPRLWSLYFIFGALLTAGLGALFYFKQNYLNALLEWSKKVFPKAFHWIGVTFSILRNIPLLSIGYYSFLLVWQWYRTFAYGTTVSNKLKRLAFETLGKVLIISAYALAYLASGVMTVPAATLFIIGSAMDVFEAIYDLVLLYKSPANNDADITNAKYKWRVSSEQIRSSNQNQRLWSMVWIKLGAAILITGAVVISCLLPPNIIISLSCIIFIWLAMLARSSIISNINVLYDKHLQTELSDSQKNPYSKDIELTPALQINITPNSVESEITDTNDAQQEKIMKEAAVIARKILAKAASNATEYGRFFSTAKEAGTQTDALQPEYEEASSGNLTTRHLKPPVK